MFDPESDIDNKKGRRVVGASGSKRRKQDTSVEQEYEEDIEGSWVSSPTVSSSSSSEPFVVPTSSKRSFSDAFGRNSWEDWKSKRFVPRPEDVRLLSSLSSGRRGEIKYYTSGVFGNDMSTAENCVLLNGIAVGSGVGQRNGRQITLRSFEMKSVFWQTTAGAAQQPSRTDIYLVYDRQPNGALAATTDILDSATSLAFPKMEAKPRFEVLLHRVVTLGSFDNTTLQKSYGVRDGCCVDCYKSLGGKIVQYKSDNALIADIATGALLLLCVGYHDTYTNSAYINCRVTYLD